MLLFTQCRDRSALAQVHKVTTKPGPLDPESSVLTIRPPLLFINGAGYHYFGIVTIESNRIFTPSGYKTSSSLRATRQISNRNL